MHSPGTPRGSPRDTTLTSHATPESTLCHGAARVVLQHGRAWWVSYRLGLRCVKRHKSRNRANSLVSSPSTVEVGCCVRSFIDGVVAGCEASPPSVMTAAAAQVVSARRVTAAPLLLLQVREMFVTCRGAPGSSSPVPRPCHSTPSPTRPHTPTHLSTQIIPCLTTPSHLPSHSFTHISPFPTSRPHPYPHLHIFRATPSSYGVRMTQVVIYLITPITNDTIRLQFISHLPL